MMIRKLAFSNEPWVIDILSNATVLFVPSFNGDGRAANTRGNSTGQDLNRDHGRLTQPETQVFARFIRDYTPEVMVDGHEFGDNATCDLPLLWPRHSNTAAAVHNESKRTGREPDVPGCLRRRLVALPVPAPPASTERQSFTRVTGLKNMIVTLVEARSAGGATRPNEGNTQNNRRRKAYSHQWLIRIALDYHRANLAAVQTASSRASHSRRRIPAGSCSTATGTSRTSRPRIRATIPRRTTRQALTRSSTRRRAGTRSRRRFTPPRWTTAAACPSPSGRRPSSDWPPTASRSRTGRPVTSSGWPSRSAG